ESEERFMEQTCKTQTSKQINKETILENHENTRGEIRVLAQNNSVLEVWLSVLHSHVVWLSSPLPRGWLMSLVFVSVKKLVSKLSTNDLSLRLYSVIILDEAHERILKTDIHSNWDAHSSHQNQRGTLQGSRTGEVNYIGEAYKKLM
ncbi:hypothetical protein HID58_095710, partial [Brassica napus]